MRVLLACVHSGIERDLLRSRGYDAVSCDLKKDSKNQKYHIQGDVLEVLDDGWDAMIARPPCKQLANSGVQWLHTIEGRWNEMIEAAEFFKKFLNSKIPRVAVENSIMHKYAAEIIGRRQDQVVHPHWFGSPYQKATCWWLKGLPKLQRTHWIESPIQECFNMAPSADREEKRALSDPWMALAQVEQWFGNTIMKGE